MQLTTPTWFTKPLLFPRITAVLLTTIFFTGRRNLQANGVTASVKWGTHLKQELKHTLAYSQDPPIPTAATQNFTCELRIFTGCGLFRYFMLFWQTVPQIPRWQLWVCALCQWWEQIFQTPSLTCLSPTWVCVPFPMQSLAQRRSKSAHSSTVLRTKGLEMHHWSNNHSQN